MLLQKKILLFSFSLLSISYSWAQKSAETKQASLKDSLNFNFLSPNQISLSDSVVNYGKLFLNTPYRYGSTGTDTFDCSGFTSYIYSNFGYNLQRNSADQAQQFDTIDRTQLKTGDLVFFSGRGRGHRVGHVGIVVAAKENGEFDFIHSAVHSGVTISNSTEPYYTKRFIKANRVIGYNPMLAVQQPVEETPVPVIETPVFTPFSGISQKNKKNNTC
jgi:cell wall-associated NlpC family hydrolase